MYRVPIAAPSIGPEERNLLLEAFDSNQLTTGNYIRRFERALADYLGVKHVICVSSGSSALLLTWNALKNLNLINDVVKVPAINFATNLSVLQHLRIEWKYVDWEEPTNYPVHLMGFPYRHVEDNCLVEDCCESLGATLNGRKLGKLGLVSVASFYTSHIITTGEGGACATNDCEVADEIRSLRAFGRDFKNKPYRPYHFIKSGWNAKFTDLQAAIGIAQLNKIAKFLRRRRWIAKKIDALNWHVCKPLYSYDPEAAYFGFPIATEDPILITEKLNRLGVETRPLLTYLPQEPFSYSNHKHPKALTIQSQSFFVGCHHALSDEQVGYLLKALEVVV